jgi:glycine/D-amino acid oxidase-like deaminating enzyme
MGPMPPSLWTATAAAKPDTPPLEGGRAAGVAVVGGGYTGLSAALHLAQEGADTVVLEAAEPGWGASGRNGGQVIPGLKIEPDEVERRFGAELGGRMVELAGGAADLVFALVERHAIDCDAARNGWIQPAHSAAALRIVTERARQWAARGAPVELLDREQIVEMTGAQGYLGGWIDRRGGGLQPLSYARGLARAAQEAGAVVHGETPLTELAREGGRWRLESPRGTVTADKVVLCTNAYGGGEWPGLARSIVPAYSVQIASAPLGENLRRAILPGGQVVSDSRADLRYFRLDRDGRLLVGGHGGFTEQPPERRFAVLEGAARSFFPWLAEPQWAYRWGGLVALTPDHLPHLHEPAPGLFIGLGYFGRGIAMATLMGKLLSDRVLGRPEAERDWPTARLRPLPFHGWRRPVLEAVLGYQLLRDWLQVRHSR